MREVKIPLQQRTAPPRRAYFIENVNNKLRTLSLTDLKKKMPSTARLKLSAPGLFTDYLKTSRDTLSTDMVIRCCDGDVHLHKVVLAARLNSIPLLKTMKQNVEDDVMLMMLPDTQKSSVDHLIQLLYGNKVDGLVEKDINELNSVSNLLRISSLSLRVVEKDESSESPKSKLRIEKILKVEKKKAKVSRPPPASQSDDEDDSSVRRSKRAKVKNKTLDDFETPLRAGDPVEVAEDEEEDSKGESKAIFQPRRSLSSFQVRKKRVKGPSPTFWSVSSLPKMRLWKYKVPMHHCLTALFATA